MNNDLSQTIMRSIADAQITPSPRWHFVFLGAAFWILAAVSVFVGSIAVAAMCFIFTDYNSHGLLVAPHDVSEFLLMVPYLWLVILAVFLYVTKVCVAHTRGGYRHSFLVVVLLSIIASTFFGTVLHLLGYGERTHALMNRVALYDNMTEDAHDVWDVPRRGRLAGIVQDVTSPDDFSLIDFRGTLWTVHIVRDPLASIAIFPVASSTVRLFGVYNASSSQFVAQSILLWDDRRPE
jgi:hypothetical protein